MTIITYHNNASEHMIIINLSPHVQMPLSLSRKHMCITYTSQFQPNPPGAALRQESQKSLIPCPWRPPCTPWPEYVNAVCQRHISLANSCYITDFNVGLQAALWINTTGGHPKHVDILVTKCTKWVATAGQASSILSRDLYYFHHSNRL